MGRSLLVAASRSSESFSTLGNPRLELCGCSEHGESKVEFLALMSAFALIPARCFNLQNAMLGFHCAQLECFPRHDTAEIAEFACGFQCSDQRVY